MSDTKDLEMKNLGNLSPAKGSNHKKKRLGRGIGSGLGKTAGRGHGGQKSRKSGNVRPGFEGGSMPLYMRLPKRGFTSLFRQEFNIINIDNLGSLEDGCNVDLAKLQKMGLIRNAKNPIKLLSRGKMAKKINITVNKASSAAQEAIEASGGSITILGVKKRGDAARAKLLKVKKKK